MRGGGGGGEQRKREVEAEEESGGSIECTIGPKHIRGGNSVLTETNCPTDRQFKQKTTMVDRFFIKFDKSITGGLTDQLTNGQALLWRCGDASKTVKP